jgi:hypothetical protein
MAYLQTDMRYSTWVRVRLEQKHGTKSAPTSHIKEPRVSLGF